MKLYVELDLPAACVHCAYYVGDDTEGKCHVYPPTHKGFPKVNADDFCSEFDVTVLNTQVNEPELPMGLGGFLDV